MQLKGIVRLSHSAKKMDEGQASFLLLSGGIGSRSGADIPKQFVEIAGLPIIAYSLMVADNAPEIGEIIVNTPDGYEAITKRVLAKHVNKTPVRIVPAGYDRQESVHILCRAATLKTVILHEAARPMVDHRAIKTLLHHPKRNVGLCLPISFSMCKIDTEKGRIIGAVDRSDTQNIQLPQKFSRKTLLKAHKKAADIRERFTEDAILCMRVLGKKVYFVQGEQNNIKVTTPEDFKIAKQFLKRENSSNLKISVPC